MKNTLHHPSAFIDAGDVTIIRDNAAAAEQLGMARPDQLAIIYQQKWFKLLVPQIYSGREITLPQLVRLQEAISWTDGSTGWIVTLCSGAGWFGGFLDPQIAQQVFKDDAVCLAGSGLVGGIAEITANGYIINGTWKYASGAHHATHITANCSIKKDGETVLNDAGEPLVLPFIFDKKDVTILPTWKYVGMVATGSDAFEVKELEVADDRRFKIDPAAAVIPAPLYQYPFLQMAEATLAVNLSGIAMHFIDLCTGIFHEKIEQPRLTDKQKAFLKDELANTKHALDLARADFYEAVDLSWDEVSDKRTIPQAILNRVSATSSKLAHLSRISVDRLYPLCGLAAAAPGAEINRAWRDLHTASQHSLLTFEP